MRERKENAGVGAKGGVERENIKDRYRGFSEREPRRRANLIVRRHSGFCVPLTTIDRQLLLYSACVSNRYGEVFFLREPPRLTTSCLRSFVFSIVKYRFFYGWNFFTRLKKELIETIASQPRRIYNNRLKIFLCKFIFNSNTIQLRIKK